MVENFRDYNSIYEEEDVSLAYSLITYDKMQNDYMNDGEILKYPQCKECKISRND